MIRYLTALITATLAGLAGVWLVLAPAALGYPGPGVYASVPARVSVYTGAGLCAVAVLTAVCWAGVWRRRLRAEGVLPGRTTEDPTEGTTAAGVDPPPRQRDRRSAVSATPGLPEGEQRRSVVRARPGLSEGERGPSAAREGQDRRDAAGAKRARKGGRVRKGAVRAEPVDRGRVPPEAATTGPLPTVPVSVPVRPEDHELQALLGPRIAALNGGEEPGVARTAKPFDDAAGRNRAGWRAASLADDDAEETW